MVDATRAAVAAAPRGRRAGWLEAGAGLALVFPPVALLGLLVLAPAAIAVVGTLALPEGAGTRLGLDRYAAFFADPYSRANLWFTITISAASTATALAISLGLALYLRFSAGRIPALIQALALFPLFVPSIIISYALIRFLGPNGFFQMLLERVGITGYRTPYLTPMGPYIAFVWDNLPLPVLVLTAGLAQISNHAIEAARDLGAGRLRILLVIILPQLGRSVLIAGSLAFLGIVGSYTIPYLLGPAAPEMMGPYMQRTYGEQRRPEEAQVQAVILMLVAVSVGTLYVLAALRGRRAAR